MRRRDRPKGPPARPATGSSTGDGRFERAERRGQRAHSESGTRQADGNSSQQAERRDRRGPLFLSTDERRPTLPAQRPPHLHPASPPAAAAAAQRPPAAAPTAGDSAPARPASPARSPPNPPRPPCPPTHQTATATDSLELSFASSLSLLSLCHSSCAPPPRQLVHSSSRRSSDPPSSRAARALDREKAPAPLDSLRRPGPSSPPARSSPLVASPDRSSALHPPA